MVGVAALCYFGISHYLNQREITEYNSVYENARELVELGESGEALGLLRNNYSTVLSQKTENNWPVLMAIAALEGKDYFQLEIIIKENPNILKENESAALFWARMQMHKRLWTTVEPLVFYWQNQEGKFSERWKLLQADNFLISGDLERAKDSLNNWKGKGRDEANRQMRIALLAGEDEDAVLKALSSAYVAMPKSAEVRSIIGRYLDSLGIQSLARREYIAAFLLEPKNPYYGDQLAEFYRRNLSLPQAIQTWRQSFEQSNDPRTWWKSWFWERVTVSRGEILKVPTGDWWGDFPLEISSVSNDVFLDSNLYEKGQPPAILQMDESYYWLLVLESLRKGDSQKALEYLDSMPIGKFPIAENLHSLLTAVVGWRVHGYWPREITLSVKNYAHRYFKYLEAYRPEHNPEDLENLTDMEQFLKSDMVIGSLLLANGWFQAADAFLVKEELLEYKLPELNWLPYAYTKMKYKVYGGKVAVSFAKLFPEDTAVQGFLGEMLLLDGKIDQGLSKLEEIMDDPGGAGYRASYLLAMASLEKKEYGKANSILVSRKDLEKSTSGRELAAKLELAQGNEEAACNIYEDLGIQSIEGSVYRYKKAIGEGEFVRAKGILKQLIQIAPNEPIFQQWMNELGQRDI